MSKEGKKKPLRNNRHLMGVDVSFGVWKKALTQDKFESMISAITQKSQVFG